jgi:hypothetical protein
MVKLALDLKAGDPTTAEINTVVLVVIDRHKRHCRVVDPCLTAEFAANIILGGLEHL